MAFHLESMLNEFLWIPSPIIYGKRHLNEIWWFPVRLEEAQRGEVTIDQHGTKDVKAHIQDLDIPRIPQPSSVVGGAQPHWHCFCSASIHLFCISGEWDCQELHSAPNRMRLPALIFDLLLNFSIRNSRSPPKLHVCITISTRTNPFSQEAWNRRIEMFFSTVWSDPETKLEQFFYWFLKLEVSYFKKKTQILWTHETYNYRAARDWLSPPWMQQMRISYLCIRKPSPLLCVFGYMVQLL